MIKTLLLLSLISIACGEDDNDNAPTGGGIITDGGFIDDASATYTVDLTTLFSEDMFPEDYPAGANFGAVVAVIHSPNIDIFETGEIASEGMAAYAENGDAGALSSFISSDLGEENEGQFFLQTEGTVDASGSISFDVTFTPARTSLTLIAKLNPSPDWFIGISSFDIVSDNDLIDDADFNLILLDAGSKAGTTYSSSDMNENAVIGGSSDAPFANGAPILPGIASVVITRN